MTKKKPVARKKVILKRPQIIYVAGAYRGDTEANIRKARAVAMMVCRSGFGALTPHLNTANFENDLPEISDQFWLDMTQELMLRCDGVLLVPGWNGSTGTKAEIKLAKEHGIPVYENIAELQATAGASSRKYRVR